MIVAHINDVPVDDLVHRPRLMNHVAITKHQASDMWIAGQIDGSDVRDYFEPIGDEL